MDIEEGGVLVLLGVSAAVYSIDHQKLLNILKQSFGIRSVAGRTHYGTPHPRLFFNSFRWILNHFLAYDAESRFCTFTHKLLTELSSSLLGELIIILPGPDWILATFRWILVSDLRSSPHAFAENCLSDDKFTGWTHYWTSKRDRRRKCILNPSKKVWIQYFVILLTHWFRLLTAMTALSWSYDIAPLCITGLCVGNHQWQASSVNSSINGQYFRALITDLLPVQLWLQTTN